MANQSFTLAEIGHVEELEIVLTVFKLYQVPEDMIELFNEDYYSNIKGHPFFDSI